MAELTHVVPIAVTSPVKSRRGPTERSIPARQLHRDPGATHRQGILAGHSGNAERQVGNDRTNPADRERKMRGEADPIKETTPEAIRQLHGERLRVVLLTDNNRTTAGAVANTLGMDDVIPEVLPDQKADAIKRFQGEGRAVAMANVSVIFPSSPSKVTSPIKAAEVVVHVAPSRIARRLHPTGRIGKSLNFLPRFAECFEVDIQSCATIKISQRIDPIAQAFCKWSKCRTTRQHSIRPEQRRCEKSQRNPRYLSHATPR